MSLLWSAARPEAALIRSTWAGNPGLRRGPVSLGQGGKDDEFPELLLGDVHPIAPEPTYPRIAVSVVSERRCFGGSRRRGVPFRGYQLRVPQ